jgi:hypothetical protein
MPNHSQLIEWWISELAKVDLPHYLNERFQKIKETWEESGIPLTQSDEEFLEIMYADFT